MLDVPGWLEESAHRKSGQGTWETRCRHGIPAKDAAGNNNREVAHMRESERHIVAEKSGKPDGAKEPYHRYAESEGKENRLSESYTTENWQDEKPEFLGTKGIQLPEKLSQLRQKLYIKAKQEPGFRFKEG